MGLLDKIQWLLNPAVIEEFNDLCNNNYQAVDYYIRGWHSKIASIEKIGEHIEWKLKDGLPEDKEAFLLYDSKSNERQNHCLYNDWANKDYCKKIEKLSYKQKEYIVSHKTEILDLYKRFIKYVEIPRELDKYFREYPHAVASFCTKLFNVYLSSVDMPMFTIDEQGNEDATMFCALMTKKHIKSVYELTYLQKNELLNYKESFSTREKMILEQIKDNKICSDFEIDILSNVERQIYYKEFLSEHKIYNHKLTSSKEFCLKNLEALDSFIKEELIFQDLLDVFGSIDIIDFLCYRYKICPEEFSYRIKELPHKEKKYLIDNYEELADFIKAKIHDKYNKLSEEFPLGIKSFKPTIVCSFDIDSPTPIPVIRENSREWWKDRFVKAKTSGCNESELQIWYKYRSSNHFGKNDIRYILSQYQKEAERCERFKEWNKKQFIFSIQCNKLKTHFLEWWLKSNKKILNSPFSTTTNNVSEYFFAHHLSYKPFCSDESFNISPYPFVASVGELGCALMGINAIPNSALVELGNYLIELNKHEHPIAVSFHLSAVNKEKIAHLIDYHFDFLIKLLSDNGIIVYRNLEELKVSENQVVIIVDLVSTKKETREFIEKFIRKYEDKLPLLSYVSFYNEITSQNIIKLAESIEQKKNEAVRIKKEQEEKLVQERQALANCVLSWYDIGYPAMKCFSMYNYYPTTCEFEATNEEWNIRKLIWNFKANKGGAISNAKAMKEIVPSTLQCLQYFFGEYLSRLTFVCIPASTQIITKLRYEEFSKEVCRFSGMENGYPHIKVLKDKTTVREGGSFVSGELYDIDNDFFKDKYVILFDDVITRGRSMLVFKQLLENKGAFVVGGFSIGRTKHERLPNNPIDNLVLQKDKYTEYREKQLKAVLDSIKPPRNECPF